ncbi:glycoside hydrolase family 30 beta sandwich domain-containing protein [Mangrovibacter sp. MFB070]|uniref:glycoside hydrolase family 30 protein n=1 Tax=Mangrovibacter sp. MFB070 TaxID=1224318 RepID=UPI000B081C5A|nr:glycoside hydrolase family 30 beta sandwich domain-containing protein [Mangrovibacter sp. MFB070]
MINLYSSSDKYVWQNLPYAEDSTEAPGLILSEARERSIDGFGGCFNELGMKALNTLEEPQRAALLDDLFSPTGECQLTLGRVPVGASDYALSWYSLNEHEDDYAMEHFSIERDKRYLLPYVKEALKRQPGMKLFASPWSPPTWLKTHQAYNFGRLRGDSKTQAAYALYFQKFVEAWRSEGATIHQVHIQNEVAADQKFPSCVWDGEQLRVFIRDYLGPQFAANQIPCEIWLGTINAPAFMQEPGEDYDDYAGWVLRDPKAAQFIKGVGYQWAGKNALQRTVMSYPSLRYYQTENECGDGGNTWQYAHYVFGLFRHYLINGANGYFYWNMVLESGGESTWGWRQNCMISIDPAQKKVTYNPEYHVMRHFSGLIKPGARHVPLSGALSGNAVAFANPDGSIVVNISNPYPQETRLSLAACGRQLTTWLPGNSITSVVVGN